ncbi:hypothetical protein GCM10010320_01400 [Streptomyces caelestis]|nr:hypothetical protein GCM10010320_01400 [Streptomyces caelestis]
MPRARVGSLARAGGVPLSVGRAPPHAARLPAARSAAGSARGGVRPYVVAVLDPVAPEPEPEAYAPSSLPRPVGPV